jgi:hypothetical protein
MAILETDDVLICDANVLIDFIGAGADKVLKDVCKTHKIYVPSPIRNEVEKEIACKIDTLGMIEYVPDYELMIKAAAKYGQCSPQDAMCLLICEKMKWCCLTNDKGLRSQCEKKGIKTIWGLQLILYLKEKGRLTVENGKKQCLKIASHNKTITKELVKTFFELIEKK